MEMTQSVQALSALANESRLAVFRALVQRGPEGLKPGELAERCGIPDSTLSFHLAHLLRAGLVTRRREGRTLSYAAQFSTVNALLSYLMENCCAGRSQDTGPEPQISCKPSSPECGEGCEMPTKTAV